LPPEARMQSSLSQSFLPHAYQLVATEDYYFAEKPFDIFGNRRLLFKYPAVVLDPGLGIGEVLFDDRAPWMKVAFTDWLIYHVVQEERIVRED
jgi:hypothetical protein